MSRSVKDLLFGITINKVSGDFECKSLNLSSIEGSPESVGGHFNCQNNDLTSLEGSPESVGGHFSCSNNDLTSFEGSPKSVGGGFYCYYNPQLLQTYKTQENIIKYIKDNIDVKGEIDV